MFSDILLGAAFMFESTHCNKLSSKGTHWVHVSIAKSASIAETGMTPHEQYWRFFFQLFYYIWRRGHLGCNAVYSPETKLLCGLKHPTLHRKSGLEGFDPRCNAWLSVASSRSSNSEIMHSKPLKNIFFSAFLLILKAGCATWEIMKPIP